MHTSLTLAKYCSKFPKPGLQENVNHELSDAEVQFGKGRGIQDQIANTCWVSKKQEDTRKESTSI